MSKIDEKREAVLREITERCTCPPGTYGSFHHHDSCWRRVWPNSPMPALRKAFRLGWEERNETVPHIVMGSRTVTRVPCKLKEHRDHCARLGGACRSFAGEEGGRDG